MEFVNVSQAVSIASLLKGVVLAPLRKFKNYLVEVKQFSPEDIQGFRFIPTLFQEGMKKTFDYLERTLPVQYKPHIKEIRLYMPLLRYEVKWPWYAMRDRLLGKRHGEKNYAKIHFVTFYTEGPPYDNAMTLTSSGRILLRAIRPFVASAKAYTARELRASPETALYIEEFEEEAICNYATNKMGFFRWKPHIILETLKKATDDDIVYYRDANVKKSNNISYHPMIFSGANESFTSY